MEAEERPVKKRRLTIENESELIETNDSSNTGAIQNYTVADGGGDPERSDSDKSQVADGHGSGENDHAKPGTPNLDDGDQDDLPAPEITAPLANVTNGNQFGPPMSKNQQKKLQKKLDWESKRDERKVIRKQKLAAKRERKRAARDEALANGDQPLQQPKPYQKPVTLPIAILIDCDFDDLMRDPERKSLAAQITRSYSDNRKAPFQSHLAICSFGGQLRERFDNVLSHYKGWKGVKFLGCDFVEASEQAKAWMKDPKHGGEMAGVFSKYSSTSTGDPEVSIKAHKEAEVVYLTSESDHTLTELKPYSTYIIGGLVDKNREKGVCYKRATKRGIKTARLPIGEFMDMQSRKVLATNHVNEIMVRWLECGDWGEAFMTVIPKRKGGKLKEATDGEGAVDGDEADGNINHDDEHSVDVEQDNSGTVDDHNAESEPAEE